MSYDESIAMTHVPIFFGNRPESLSFLPQRELRKIVEFKLGKKTT